MFRFFKALLIVTMLFAGIAWAQLDSASMNSSSNGGVDLSRGVHFEISPHTSLVGGSGAFGIRLGMNYGSFNLELSGEQVIGRTANLYPVSVNAMLNLATRGRIIPFGSAGVGLLLTVPTSTIGDETVSSIGFNFGGGARYFLTNIFGIRAEARQYVTSIHNQRDARDELLVFQEFSLGVSFLLR